MKKLNGVRDSVVNIVRSIIAKLLYEKIKMTYIKCELCEDGEGEYPCELMSYGVIVKKMICVVCLAMIQLRKGGRD